MNWKRFWLVAILVYVALMITDIIVHGHILMGVYQAADASGAFRQAQDSNRFMWVYFVTGAVFSFFFSFFFVKGYESKGLLEGIRFGIYVALFYYFTANFDAFVIYPIPYRLVWYRIIWGGVQMIILGIIAALVYKPKSPAAA